MREENLQRLNSARTDLSDQYFLVYRSMFADLEAASQYAKGDLLDIGCGNKPYQKIFNNVNRYFGCDIVNSSDKSVDFVSDSTNIALANETFDTVLSTQVIEHVQEPQKLCQEAFRLLKPGGYFILSGPMYWHLHEEPYDFYRFTKHGFRYLLEKAGFEVIDIISNGGKWALCGLVIIHTIDGTRLKRRPVIKFINGLFSWLDDKEFDDMNTSNYVVIAKKTK
jgi:SAM-dependent methyltransferase